MDTVRIATIGTSMITGMFLDALEACEGATFVGAYSRSAEKAEEFTRAHGGTTHWDDLDALAASSEVDAVYIASPNLLHKPQALQMIAGGKHVLVEKPLATNATDAEEVLEAARAAGVQAMEAMRLVHDPGYVAIAEALPKLGVLRRATLRYGKYSSRYDLVLKGEHTNIFDPSLATGALMDIGVYPVNAMALLFGRPDDIACFADTRDVTGEGDLIDLCGSILADYDGHIVEVAYSKVTDDLLPCQIEGEEATLVFSPATAPQDITITHRDGSQETVAVGPRKDTGDDEVPNMIYEIQDFVAAIGGRGSIERAQENTLVALSLMDAVRFREGILFPGDAEEVAPDEA